MERCIATWRLTNAVKTSWSVQCLKKWHINTKLTVESNVWEVFFFYKQGNRQRHSNWFRHAKQRSREGGMRKRVMEEDFKLTPLWIFPNTVYYNTVSLNTVCLWKWNQDKSVTEKRNPKEVTLSFFFFGHFALQGSSRFKGLEDDRMERTKEK